MIFFLNFQVNFSSKYNVLQGLADFASDGGEAFNKTGILLPLTLSLNLQVIGIITCID